MPDLTERLIQAQNRIKELKKRQAAAKKRQKAIAKPVLGELFWQAYEINPHAFDGSRSVLSQEFNNLSKTKKRYLKRACPDIYLWLGGV